MSQTFKKRAASFEQEALWFALDGDTVQNLITIGETDWHLSGDEVISLLRAMGEAGLLRAYVSEGAESVIVPLSEIEAATLPPYPDLWLEKTDGTIARLNAMAAAQG